MSNSRPQLHTTSRRTTKTLSVQFAEPEMLDKTMRKNLQELGFDM